jgi:chitin disaccharide deacetylase
MRLIVNADDLGKSSRINEAIFRLVDAGVVTSATLMPNGPAYEDGLSGLRARAFRAVGVHLNITEFKPLTGASGLTPLLDECGNLARSFRDALVTPAILRAVDEEWRAQIQTMIRAGLTPSHLDSHHHVHTFPQFGPVVRKLQSEFGIRRIRRAKNIYLRQSVRTWAALVWRNLSQFMLTRNSNSVTTDGFTDLRTFLLLPSLPPGMQTIEIMVHPGHPNHEDEEPWLLAPQCRQRFSQCRLISYLDLPE